MSDPLDPVFLALADPTRRSVMALLAGSGPTTATQLAAQFPVTRQAIAKHLQVLADVGLAVSERVGRETRWTLKTAVLVPAADWISHLERNSQLDAGFADRVADLQRHLEDQRTGRASPPGFRPPRPAAARKR